MKPYLTYGAFIAIGNAVITLVLYLVGFHSEPEKLSTANYVSLLGGLVIGISLLIIGVRARRSLAPTTEDFTYGNALGAAVMISLFATLFGVAFQFIYQSFINPAFADVTIQAQINAMQAKGIPSEHIEKAEGMMRMMLKPAVQAVTGFIFGMIINVLVSLIVAAFLRRKAIADQTAPPPL
jgi:uncharacterized membrane protein